jgi:predicted site-specific integrase-resolvase
MPGAIESIERMTLAGLSVFVLNAAKGLICRRFGCANVMNEMELEMIVGYARVSTDGQTLDAQHSALMAAGAGQVFSEKISGVVTERKALARAIAALGPGDVLMVTRLDRLARVLGVFLYA